MISKNPFAIHGAIHTEKEYQKAIANKELLESEFSASSLCNLDCPFCYTNAHQREKGYEASLEEIDNFLGQVSDAGAKTVRIVGLGEPFLDKRVYDQGKFPFLDLSKKHGLTTLIYTNGTQINEEIATKLFEYDSSLVLKLYSFSPEVFEEMTGNKGFFTRENQIPLVSGKYIPKSLQTLIDAGFNKTNPTRLGINTVVTPQNVNEIENLYQFARFNNLATRFSGALIGQKEFGEEQVVNSEDLQSEYKKLVDWEKKFSGIIVAHCQPDEVIARLRFLKNMSIEEIQKRLGNQIDQDCKVKRADLTIDTTCSFVEMIRRANKLYHEIRKFWNNLPD